MQLALQLGGSQANPRTDQTAVTLLSTCGMDSFLLPCPPDMLKHRHNGADQLSYQCDSLSMKLANSEPAHISIAQVCPAEKGLADLARETDAKIEAFQSTVAAPRADWAAMVAAQVLEQVEVEALESSWDVLPISHP